MTSDPVITVTQTCDSCGKTRDLAEERNDRVGPLDIPSVAGTKGWREVRTGRHLCSTCIDGILG